MPVDHSKPSSSTRTRRVVKREPEDDTLDSSRARDQELKRSRGEISCAECRRLKIKCDKLVPCTSCSRRGCAALCPNGSLATGQGTRFVLAATEHLHKRIAKMTERIRQLEDALQMLQAKITTEPHPLLVGDASGQVQSVEEDPMEDATPATTSEIVDALGTLSMSEHGVARFFGPTGGTEYLLFSEAEVAPGSPSEGQSPRSCRSSMTPPVGGEFIRFSYSFPFTPIGSPPQVKALIESYLPSWDRAAYLSDTYIKNCGWLFQGVTKEQLLDEMLPSIYKRKVVEGNEYDGPHDLALIFLIFALGAVVDLGQEPYSAEGEHYHHLARAALCLQPVLEKPTLVTIQALRLLSIYNAMSGVEIPGAETTMETTWSVSTLASQLGQSIGLHRDSAKWGLSATQVERRRILFWDLFISDVWQSLMTGRPPAFSRDYVDCQFPTIPPREPSQEIPGMDEPNDELIYDNWAPRFAYHCVSEVAYRSLSAEAPTYNIIMELDRKIREFPVPAEAITMLEDLESPSAVEEEPPDLSTSMQKFVFSHCREVVLLWAHRSYFAQAIMDYPSNPLRSPYAPSFLATYRSSDTILKAIKEEFSRFPHICSRFWIPWTFAFSAAVVFGTVVTRGPRSHLAGGALQQLDTACELFTKASLYSRKAAKALPILLKLQEKAHGIYKSARSDPDSDGALWSTHGQDDDELAILAGKTRLVESKRPSPSPAMEAQPRGDPHGLAPAVGSAVFDSTSTSAISQPQLLEAGSTLHPPPILPSVPAISPISGPSTPSGWPTQQSPNPPTMSQRQQQSLHHHNISYSSNPSPELTLPPISQPLGYGSWSGPQSQPSIAQTQISHSQSPQPLSQPQMSYPSHFPQQHSPNHLQQQFAEYTGPYGHSHSHGHGYARDGQRTIHALPAESLGHGHRGMQPGSGQSYVPPQDLVQLGIAPGNSRLTERWTNFVQQSGFLDGPGNPSQYRH